MSLTAEETGILCKRERLLRYWPVVSCLLLATMASLLPVVVWMCLFLVVFIILFMFMAFANERRYLRLIRRLRSGEGDG